MEKTKDITKEEMKEFKAIDSMCRLGYCRPETIKEQFKHYEFRVLASTTFKGVAQRLGIKAGEEWKVFASYRKPSVKEMLVEMDEIGVDYVFMDQQWIWSQREFRLMAPISVETISKIIEESEGRVIGGASYNPFRIQESIKEVETAVKDYGFKYVWFHPISFGLAPNDKKCYPLYIKCLELGVPVCMQVGHSAEPLLSVSGHPMLADEVALDFPELTIVLTHTGWPWIDEWISMLWRHPNVYGNIGAYYPSGLDPSLVRFMDSARARAKVLWATNALGLTRCKKEFLELPIRDETKRRVLYENAIEVFKLPGK